MISTGTNSLFSKSLATLLAVALCSSSFASNEVNADEPSMEIEFEDAHSNKQPEASDSSLLYWVVGGVVTAVAAVFGVPKLFKRTPAVAPQGQQDAGQQQQQQPQVPQTPPRQDAAAPVPRTPAQQVQGQGGTPASGAKSSGGKKISKREMSALGLSPNQ